MGCYTTTMFRKPDLTRPQPKWKRPLYLILTTLLGLLLSIGAHAVLETWYLDRAAARGWTIVWSSPFGIGDCALPVWVQLSLPLVGLVGGWSVGRIWWRYVYVDGRWGGKT